MTRAPFAVERVREAPGGDGDAVRVRVATPPDPATGARGLDPDPFEWVHLSAKISRKLRLLRAHGVIQKIPKTHS